MAERLTPAERRIVLVVVAGFVLGLALLFFILATDL